MTGLEFDHVLLAAGDIDAAATRLWDRHGLASVVGGRHPGHGTGNRIVPLGSSYIEIIGIVDTEEAAGSELGRWIQQNTEDGDRLMAVCLRSDDIEEIAARLGIDPVRMSRTRPDGAVLSWSTVGLDEMLADPSRPFFIRWEMPDGLYPGLEKADHRTAVDGVAWVEIGADREPLRDWLGDDRLDIRAGGGIGVTAVGIRITGGVIEIRN